MTFQNGEFCMDTRETTARAQSQPKLFRQVRETLEAEVNFGPNCVFARVLRFIFEEAAEQNFILERVLEEVLLSLKY